MAKNKKTPIRKRKAQPAPKRRIKPSPSKTPSTKKASIKKAPIKKAVPKPPPAKAIATPKKKVSGIRKVVIRRADTTKKKVRQERHPLYSQIYKLQDQKDALKKKKKKTVDDITQYRKLNNKILHLREEIRHKNLELGARKKPKLTEETKEKMKEDAEEDLSEDYVLEPSTPFTKWEAMEHFDKNKWQSKVKWFILDGKRIAASNMKDVEIEALDLWESIGSAVSFAISFNPKTGTFKYQIY